MAKIKIKNATAVYYHSNTGKWMVQHDINTGEGRGSNLRERGYRSALGEGLEGDS